MSNPPPPSEKHIADFKSVFTMFDRDGNGAINVRDLGGSLRALGHNPTDADLADLIAEIDETNSGALNLKSFVSLLSKEIKDTDTDKDLLEIFKYFDKDNNGFISPLELKEGFTSMGERITDEEVENMIKEFDFDRDGQINYDEFVRLLSGK